METLTSSFLPSEEGGHTRDITVKFMISVHIDGTTKKEKKKENININKNMYNIVRF